MTKFITRAYNSFKTNPCKYSITKTSKESRLQDEINYYLSLPKDISFHFPRLISSNSENNTFDMELEYYAYSNLGKYFVEQLYIDENFWNNVFNYIKSYLNDNSKYTNSSYKESINDFKMIEEKTEREYNNLITSNTEFLDLANSSLVYVNSIKCRPFITIWESLKKEYSKKINNSNRIIHGDLCFSNILYGVNPVNNDVILKFIDPRGSYGEKGIYGNYLYDLAKLSHSTNGGYEHFINDKFDTYNQLQNSYSITYENSILKKYVNELFIKTFSNEDLDVINFIEGTIFIGMCARHYDSKSRQMTMYLTGLKILNQLYEKLT